MSVCVLFVKLFSLSLFKHSNVCEKLIWCKTESYTTDASRPAVYKLLKIMNISCLRGHVHWMEIDFWFQHPKAHWTVNTFVSRVDVSQGLLCLLIGRTMLWNMKSISLWISSCFTYSQSKPKNYSFDFTRLKFEVQYFKIKISVLISYKLKRSKSLQSPKRTPQRKWKNTVLSKLKTQPTVMTH